MEFSGFKSDILQEIVLRLPSKDIRSLCQTSRTYYNFCNSRPGFWRGLIQRDYGNIFSLEELTRKVEQIFTCIGNDCWNYNVYTRLIYFLPKIVQLRVYLNMNDMTNFNSEKFSKEERYLAAILNGRLDIANGMNEVDPSVIDLGKYILGKDPISEWEMDAVVVAAAEYGLVHFLRKVMLENPALSGDTLAWSLLVAAENGHIHVLEFLIEEFGANTNTPGYNPLDSAAAGGHLETVKYLLDRGARIETETLTEAVGSGNIDVVKFLVESGADPDFPFHQPLNAALTEGYSEIADYLRSVGG